MPSTLKTKLKQEEFYCVSCRGRVKGTDICIETLKNKRIKGGVPTMVGDCKKCKSEVFKFIKHSQKTKLTKKYGKC